MLIIRRKNCANTVSVVVTVCKWPSSMQVKREVQLQFPLDLHTGRPLTEGEYTSCCISKIFPPDDEHDVARNMCRAVINIL